MSNAYRAWLRDGIDADLIYSPDDGGWYAQDFGPLNMGTTQIFATMHDLVDALEADAVTWES